jgi:hypothetical protein
VDENAKAELRKRLLQYPGATEESVSRDLDALEERAAQKRSLIEDRRMSNALAEAYLDRKGFPRPPGWHSVFFYPDSNRPRNTFMFLAALFGLLAWWLAE